MSPAVRSAHTAKRARIARTTRLIEKVGLDNSQQAKSVPSEWLPAENLNCRIYTKKTLAELLSKAFDADLVNLTDCYGIASRGCEPDICHLLCTPFSVTPGPDKVFFFAGVGTDSEYRRVFQDGGSKTWTFKSSVVSNRKTDDRDYLCKRYVGTGDYAELRRAVVHFRDSATNQLVWALIYLRRQPVLPGRRILQNVRSDAWHANSVALCKAGLSRRRPTHQPFNPDALEPGSVYLLPTDFSFDDRPDKFMRVAQDGHGVTFVMAADPASDGNSQLGLEQERHGNRLLVRVGLLCELEKCVHLPCNVSKSSAEYIEHIYDVLCK